MYKKNTIWKAVAIFYLLINCAYAVNDEILADRLMLSAVSSLEKKDFEKAKEVFSRLEELDVDLPPSYLYHFALSLKETGQLESALNKLNDYLESVGRQGDYYQDALLLYNDIESIQQERSEEINQAKIFLLEIEKKNLLKSCEGEELFTSEIEHGFDNRLYIELSEHRATRIKNYTAYIEGEFLYISFDYRYRAYGLDGRKREINESKMGSESVKLHLEEISSIDSEQPYYLKSLHMEQKSQLHFYLREVVKSEIVKKSILEHREGILGSNYQMDVCTDAANHLKQTIEKVKKYKTVISGQ